MKNMFYTATVLCLMAITASAFAGNHNKQNKEEAKHLIVKRAMSPLSWNQILIYPEGTCTNGKALIQFKNGKNLFKYFI